tara:strand:- start:1855 stop:2094 length:240 start_codon:yes stop_codon:yes gene_type:complete
MKCFTPPRHGQVEAKYIPTRVKFLHLKYGAYLNLRNKTPATLGQQRCFSLEINPLIPLKQFPYPGRRSRVKQNNRAARC